MREQLDEVREGLSPAVRSVMQERSAASVVRESARLTNRHRELVLEFRNPPVLAAAQALWYRGKVLELLSELLFETPSEALFCSRQKKMAQERVEAVRRILREDLAQPPNLKVISRKVGCSPYYLSRTFSREMGRTIPQYLREIRMERAADLLRSGECNVTEAALEVGYNSISHFSHAFCQTMGCCPGMYPSGAA